MADLGLIPGLGRSPGEEKGYPLQYSGLEKSMDSIVHGVPKSWTQLSDFGGSDRKASACNVGDLGLIHGSGRSSGEGNATHSSRLPGKSHGWRNLAGYSP